MKIVVLVSSPSIVPQLYKDILVILIVLYEQIATKSVFPVNIAHRKSTQYGHEDRPNLYLF